MLRHSQVDKENIQIDQGSSDTQVAEAARLILVSWSCLVFVALASVLLATASPSGYLYALLATPIPSQITCAPHGGLLNLTAGQGNHKDGYRTTFQLTEEFFSQNNCLNPCGTPERGNAIFRDRGDLVPVPFSLIGSKNFMTPRFFNSQRSNAKLYPKFLNEGALVICISFIIAQGIWAIFCGPRSPAEVRILLYRFVSRVQFRGDSKSVPSQARHIFAKILALFVYTSSVAATLASIPTFVLSILAAEWFLQSLPQSENENHVGAWSPWANTGLILIAAFITRYHATIRRMTRLSLLTRKKSTAKVRGQRSSRCREALLHPGYTIWRGLFVTPSNYASDKASEITGAIRKEWKETRSFWKDPERCSAAYRTTSEASQGEQDEGTGLPSISRLSDISMTGFGLPKSSTEESRGDEVEGNESSVHSGTSHTLV
jgi:hypothetical protein